MSEIHDRVVRDAMNVIHSYVRKPGRSFEKTGCTQCQKESLDRQDWFLSIGTHRSDLDNFEVDVPTANKKLDGARKYETSSDPSTEADSSTDLDGFDGAELVIVR